ncbi:MarR family transcriptional regulator [Maritimibacter sp. DP07]|uniref:MarR family transcriptional regulator n=1 Tax=Maritimibacter harenae TaxID=2606218 RepID=A0A845M4T8_9RHOB|nr:helix-turn-helix domain-containing protein [Maritimibacter harenae]MZR15045.1 MarR family transcriptional regulator [Maritimibacter harenae]
MSHSATHWLATIPADQLSASEFRVLFHLCDCHNPSHGCFPTQAYLIERAGVSNGTLNTALRSMEDRGLIQRKRRYDDKEKKRLPTRYVLGFERTTDHTPNSGDRARPNSNLDHDLSPIQDTTYLQPTGDKPVRNREVTGKGRKSDQQSFGFSEEWEPGDELKRWAWAEGFTDHDIDQETKLCALHHIAKGSRFQNLDAAWKAWMRRAKAYRKSQNVDAPAPASGLLARARAKAQAGNDA